MSIQESSIGNVIVDALVTDGYAVIPDFVPSDKIRPMYDELIKLRDAGNLRRAGVGKGAERTVNNDVRGDYIHWIDSHDQDAEYQAYLAQLESLRQNANRSLSLGLFEFEAHYAIYPPGSHYGKHLDQFKADSRRTLTTILYLNPEWHDADGGQLRIYLNDEHLAEYVDVRPLAGTLVTFLSSRFWHEVLPTHRDRVSLTGWFKTRG
jgi:SM-20-related protein